MEKQWQKNAVMMEKQTTDEGNTNEVLLMNVECIFL